MGQIEGAASRRRRGGARVRRSRLRWSGGGDETRSSSARPSDPTVLDGALVSDGESIRVIDQMTEGLTALKPGTSEIVPSLADRLDDERRRAGVDVQPPRGRDLPRRRAVQRRGRLLQLRPLVQLPGFAPEARDTYYWQYGFGGGFKNPAEGSPAPEEASTRAARPSTSSP